MAPHVKQSKKNQVTTSIKTTGTTVHGPKAPKRRVGYGQKRH